MREGYTLWQIAAMRLLLALALVAASVSRVHADDKPAHEFISDAKALLVVGACAEGEAPANIKPQTYAAHCKAVRASQDAYKKNWVAKARPFFDRIVPAGPHRVVYPFAGGDLATALAIHGYEPVSLKYFKLTKDGDIVYLTDDDLAQIDKIKDVGKRNAQLSNVELTFHKICSQHTQIYRHIMANLDDKHLEEDPSALAHLEKKGHVAGMTKAASYLLSFSNFATMRKYIIDHVDWMISDTTGLPPKYGVPAGFEYEVYGNWEKSNMKAGDDIAGDWRPLWKKQPKRPLDFRFGYPEGKHFKGHLVVMRRK
jgi:hypothetical protein